MPGVCTILTGAMGADKGAMEQKYYVAGRIISLP